MITILYFARLREVFNTAEESLDLPAATDVTALLALLRSRGGVWAEQLAEGRNIKVAVNQEMAAAATPVRDGDEIAIFPPVTGG